jgi:hypothetical protein
MTMTFQQFLRWDNPAWYFAAAVLTMSGQLPAVPPVVGVLFLGIGIGLSCRRPPSPRLQCR